MLEFNWWQKAEMFFYTALRSLYCPQISTLVITDKDWRFWTILINSALIFFKSLITSIRRCQLDDYVHALSFQYWKAVTFFGTWFLIRSLNSDAIFFIYLLHVFTKKTNSKFSRICQQITISLNCLFVIDLFSKTIFWKFGFSFSYNLEEW